MNEVGTPGIRLLIVDERGMVGHGLRAIFQSSRNVESVAWIRDPDAAESAVQATRPHVALVSASLRRRPAADVISGVRSFPDAPAVVVLVGTPDSRSVREAIEWGAIGLVAMSDSAEDLVDAVAAARRGIAWLPAAAMGALMATPATTGAEDPAMSRLTRREREVLELLVSGADRSTIAGALYCSPATVRTHIRNVLRKLGAHSTVEAVDIAVRSGLHRS